MNSIYLNMCCHLYTIPSNFYFYFAEVADSYIQISSGFVQLATVENTELDKYVHYEIIVTIHETLLNEYWSIFSSVLTSILVWIHVYACDINWPLPVVFQNIYKGCWSTWKNQGEFILLLGLNCLVYISTMGSSQLLNDKCLHYVIWID